MAVEIKELLIKAFIGGSQDDDDEASSAEEAEEIEQNNQIQSAQDTISMITNMLKQQQER